MKKYVLLFLMCIGIYAKEIDEVIVYRTPSEKWWWDFWIDAAAWCMTGFNWLYVMITVGLFVLICLSVKALKKKKRRSRW